MTKEIYKYPYNRVIGEETKIFLSDQICRQIVKISYKNGQIFCTIRDKTTCKNKEIELKATHNFGGGECWFSGKVNNLPQLCVVKYTYYTTILKKK